MQHSKMRQRVYVPAPVILTLQSEVTRPIVFVCECNERVDWEKVWEDDEEEEEEDEDDDCV